MKQPIEPSEIRKGDLIRYEYPGNSTNGRADEWCATSDRDDRNLCGGTHYLLDRPAPPVDLPTEPTLGWLSWRDQDLPAICDTSEFGYWYANTYNSHALSQESSVPIGMVTAFTPATALPTRALDELRDEEERALNSDSIDDKNDIRRDAIFDLLAAIDEANR